MYDKDGNLNDWWTPTDEKKFKEKAQCIIDQYGSYVVPGTGNMTVIKLYESYFEKQRNSLIVFITYCSKAMVLVLFLPCTRGDQKVRALAL